jgi:hypothetical protein
MIWCSGLADNEMLSRFAREISAQAVKWNTDHLNLYVK